KTLPRHTGLRPYAALSLLFDTHTRGASASRPHEWRNVKNSKPPSSGVPPARMAKRQNRGASASRRCETLKRHDVKTLPRHTGLRPYAALSLLFDTRTRGASASRRCETSERAI